jgi:regulator of extracellular matrix RemA (YlzA/DUF370 family)
MPRSDKSSSGSGGGRATRSATKSSKPRQEAARQEAARDSARDAGSGLGVARMLSIGYGNLVHAARVVAVVSPQSAPMRRLREQASDRGKLIDATEGRRTRSIIVTDSDHVILSAINPETIASRLSSEDLERGPG